MSLNENQPATFPCLWCSNGVHDLTREIEAIRNEGRCSVSMIQRRFKYGHAHALDACRQLEARNWLVIEDGGRCALGKFFLSPQDGSEHADGVSSESLEELARRVEERWHVCEHDAGCVMGENNNVIGLAQNADNAANFVKEHNG